MFSALKRKLGLAAPVVPADPTFKMRVETFWKWYAGVAPRFYAAIEAGKCAELTDETSTKVFGNKGEWPGRAPHSVAAAG